MRTPEEVQKQRVEYFIKELEEILVHDTIGNSIQCAIDNIGWLANKCVHLLMEKMDVRTMMAVAEETAARHPEWFMVKEEQNDIQRDGN